jgi:hypothetical protein
VSVSPGTRFDAFEVNTSNRPSPETAKVSLFELAGTSQAKV